MADLNEQAPVAPEAPPEPVAPSESPEVVRLRNHAAQLLDEMKKERDKNRALAKQIEDFQSQQEERKVTEMVDQNQFQPLWEQAQETNNQLRTQIADLQRELNDTRQTAERETLKSRFTAAVSKDVIEPEQFFELNKSNIRQKDGKPVYLLGGVETDLATALETLRQPGSRYEHHFRLSGMGGMGAGGTTTASSGAPATSGNPYLTNNVTARIALEMSNPDEASRLKAQAAAAKS